MRRIATLALIVLALLPALAGAQPRQKNPRYYSGEVGDRIVRAVADYNRLSDFPLPELSEDEMADLLTGRVVRLRWKQPVPGTETGDEPPAERNRVVALYLVDKPRQDVWLSAMDPHTVASEKVTEIRLEGDGHGNSTWYQFIDLPWPVENRHWVIDVKKSAEIAAATNNLVWEAPWYPVENGRELAYELTQNGGAGKITYDDAKEAVYLDANTGAWAMFEITPNLTLLTYQLTVVLGGMLPEGLTARFAMRELESLCKTIEKNSAKVWEHYDADHERVFGGDGVPLSSEHTRR